MGRSGTTPIGASTKPQNLIINGNFDVWQRGNSGTSTLTSKVFLSADRWHSFLNNAGGSYTIARSTDVPVISAPASMKVTRPSGSTNTAGIYVGQAIESVVISKLRSKVATLSFWAKAGANYSPTSGNLLVSFSTGTGTDESPLAAYTGFQNLVQTNIQLTTVWQKYTISIPTIGSAVNEAKLWFISNNTGTAGADDSFFIAQVMLHEGNFAAPFRTFGENHNEELAACQRYFEISWAIGGGSSSTTTFAFRAAYGGDQYLPVATYAVSKRVTPTVTLFNTATGVAGNFSGFTATLSNGSVAGFAVLLAGVTQYAIIQGSWTADAEI